MEFEHIIERYSYGTKNKDNFIELISKLEPFGNAILTRYIQSHLKINCLLHTNFTREDINLRKYGDRYHCTSGFDYHKKDVFLRDLGISLITYKPNKQRNHELLNYMLRKDDYILLYLNEENEYLLKEVIFEKFKNQLTEGDAKSAMLTLMNEKIPEIINYDLNNIKGLKSETIKELNEYLNIYLKRPTLDRKDLGIIL